MPRKVFLYTLWIYVMVLIQLEVKLERCRKLLVNYKEEERDHLLYCASGLVVRQPRSSEQRTVT